MGYRQDRRDAADRSVLGKARKAGYRIQDDAGVEGGDKSPYYVKGPSDRTLAGPFESWHKASIYARAHFRAHDSAWTTLMTELSADEIVAEYVKLANFNSSDGEIKTLIKRKNRDRAADERAAARERRAAEPRPTRAQVRAKQREARAGTTAADDATKPCARCGAPVRPLERFPGGICLRCHVADVCRRPPEPPDFVGAITQPVTARKESTMAKKSATSDRPSFGNYGRVGSAAELYKRLIMEHVPVLDDAAVHAEVVSQLGAKAAGPASYAHWYRNWLVKHGFLKLK